MTISGLLPSMARLAFGAGNSIPEPSRTIRHSCLAVLTPCGTERTQPGTVSGEVLAAHCFGVVVVAASVIKNDKIGYSEIFVYVPAAHISLSIKQD